ncbi:gem-associated protein 8 [Osmerus mordax]|uniref:gem-associated protein 8 n=1 Tax=Osmerus mordax TaxID=8014 RepID=UPI00350F6B8D
MELGKDSTWFADPMYGRYWQHYQQAMRWHQRHRHAYGKALEAAFSPGYNFQYPNTSQRYADWQNEGSGGKADEDLTAKGPREEVGHDSESETDGYGSDTDGSDSEIECDVSNMEITEELRQYFAQTERHKQELKKQQQLEAEQAESYVLADQDMHRVSWRSALPPLERPGERRGAEMKKLYGTTAAKIQGMETAMQLTFDRNCDRKQPKYWPVIPLKL